jgi:hypothetical protein
MQLVLGTLEERLRSARAAERRRVLRQMRWPTCTRCRSATTKDYVGSLRSLAIDSVLTTNTDGVTVRCQTLLQRVNLYDLISRA